ncbi:hypothetical protein [Lysinibacillus sp. NPDC056185]|uniref:hypothetical protein n=1 Tax=Lysinibacillus sp. NPDC056185 TaxID=3345739 RepID=UPI0039EF83DC
MTYVLTECHSTFEFYRPTFEIYLLTFTFYRPTFEIYLLTFMFYHPTSEIYRHPPAKEQKDSHSFLSKGLQV